MQKIEEMNKEELIAYFKELKILDVNGRVNKRVNLLKLKSKFSEIYEIVINYCKNINSDRLNILLWHFVNREQEIVKCKQCNKNTVTFDSFKVGYATFCCTKCSANSVETRAKTIETTIKKFGVEYSLQSKEVRDKVTETCLLKYGVCVAAQSEEVKAKMKATCVERYDAPNPFQSSICKEKAKQTHLKRRGVENPSQSEEVKEKKRQTNLKNVGVDHNWKSKESRDKCAETNLLLYGAKNPFQSEICKEKSRQTCFTKYGVFVAMHNEEIHERSIKNAKLKKEYIMPNNEVIFVQGYEPQFLDWYFKNNGKLEDITYNRKETPSFKYFFDGKDRVYYPDFYIKSSNTIIEIKSTWTYSGEVEQNVAKRQACLDKGYNFKFYIMNNIGDVLEVL